jgi:diadenosine tetraphosphatase ApaH/serine/threonine PP2A family protein phosphatase
MTDHLCPICYESHNGPINGVWPFASSEPCWPVDQIWRWPCGHGVHAKCIAQTRLSLLTLDGPCYVCRHPCHGGALSNFVRAFPFKGLVETLNRVPDDVASPQQVLAEPIPFVAALCCPRIVGPIDLHDMPTRGSLCWTFHGCSSSTCMPPAWAHVLRLGCVQN